MDHSTQQNQEIHVPGSLESMLVFQNTQQERNPRPQQEPALKCPRCDSINTKFCYYNNYSLTQPRYFCKSCKRYWTKGGTLRNIPVGGGCRKNKKSFSSSPSSSSSSFKKFLNDQPFAFDPIMASYFDSSDFSHPFGPPHRIENFDLVSGFENHYSSETLKNRLIESYLSSRQKLQSGYEHAEMGKIENGGWSPANDHEEVGNSTTTSVIKTTAKVEPFEGRVSERKIMREFPWQIDKDGAGVDFDTGKDYQSCNEISSSWHHGLLYSPSM